MKLSEIARALGGELRGDGAVEIVDVAAIEDALPGTLTFLADRRLAARLATTRAAAVLLPPDAPEVALPSVRVAHPYLAFVAALELLHPPPPRPAPRVDPSAVIAASARLGPGAAVGGAVVGRGTKIDSLVMVAHGCRIGPECLLAAQVGLSGSSTLGARVLLGGQVGLAGHQTVGDRAQVAAKSGVHGDVPAGAVYGGYPATEVRVWRRASAALLRLPEALRRLRRVERALGLGVEPPSEE